MPVEYPALERLEQLAHNLEGLQQRLSDRVDELRGEPLQITSESGRVEVVADPSGRVQSVQLDSRAMRLSAYELAEEITETIRRAQQEAANRLRRAVTDALGTDAPVDPFLE